MSLHSSKYPSNSNSGASMPPQPAPTGPVPQSHGLHDASAAGASSQLNMSQSNVLSQLH